jgi:uncharacterized protein YbjT (DUF2867 family)
MSRIAVTGGTGFVGRNVVQRLEAMGHEVVVVVRPAGRARDRTVQVTEASLLDAHALARAFDGCDAVVHCAGINRERGADTFEAVHVRGTRAVVTAAQRAGVTRIVLVSFLRARPDGPSPYHRSKAEAESIVRTSGLAWTVVRPGVIHGVGDHLLDHLSRAFHTFPVFGLVGFGPRLVRPVAVEDVARLLVAAALGDARLDRRSITLLGPDELTLEQAVRRVADVVGRRPRFVRLPIAIHRLLALGWEAAMDVPLVARAQVEILAEGVADPLPDAEWPPDDLVPRIPFDAVSIRAGLPASGGFGRHDLRCVTARAADGG